MALGEPASLASVSTSLDSSASGCVNGKTKRTSHNRSVESASTSSFLTNTLSSCTYSSVDAALTHHRGEESPPAAHREKVYLSRSSSSSEGKCVLGPLEEAHISDYGWKDLPRAPERRRPAEIVSRSSRSPPVRLNDGTSAAILEAHSTLLTEDTSVCSTSQPESISVSCFPRAKIRPPYRLNSSSELASRQPDGICQQTEAGRGFYPSSEDNLAPVRESHRTSDTNPCTSRGSRTVQVGEHVSYRSRTVRLPLKGRSARNETESRAFFGVRREASPPLASSGTFSLSSAIPSLSADSVCSVNSRSHSSNACKGATVPLRQSAPGPRQNSKPRFEKAGTPAETASRSETETAQCTTQQHSELRDTHREDHCRSLLQGRPVNKTSHGAPEEAVCSEEAKKRDVLFQNELSLHSKVRTAGIVHRGEQQPFRSSALSVYSQPSCPGSRILRGRRCRTGEHAALVLNELEQLQQVLRKECVRESLFRRNSVQRRVRQLQSALRHLLSSLDVEDKDLAKAPLQLRAAHQTLSRAGGSSAAPVSKGYSATSQHSTTSNGNGACCRADIAHESEHVRSVQKIDAPVDCTCLRQDSAARVGGNALLPHHSEVRTTYSSHSLERDSESSACAWVTEEAGASHFHLPSSTSSACTEHTEVKTQNVSCPLEVVSPADSPGEPSRKAHADNTDTNSVTDAVTQNVSCPLEVVSQADSPGEPSRKVYADKANTNRDTDAVTIRVDTSYLSKEPAKGTELLDTAERRYRHRLAKTRGSVMSADGPTSRKGRNSKHVDVVPCVETSFSDYGKNQLPGQSCPCHDASRPQGASDCNSRCHQSTSTVREDYSLKCREYSASDGDDKDYGSRLHAHCHEESASSKQIEKTSEASQNSRAIMGGSLALQQEPAFCATVRRSVVARRLRIRLRRTVRFRARCRMRTSWHVSRPRTRKSLLIPKASEKGTVEPQEQRVCQDNTSPACPRQAALKPPTPSVAAKTPISAESGAAAWPSEETVGTPEEKRRQPRSSHLLKRSSSERQSTYQVPTRVVLQLRRVVAEEKPADNSTTSSSPPDCLPAEHSHGAPAGNADGETAGALEANNTYQPVAKVQRTGSRGESAQVEAVSASSVKVQLVQAIWDLLHEQLAEKGKVKLARGGKSSSGLPGVVPQVGLPKGGSLSLTDLYKEAHSGLLLAFLGIEAGCGSADAIKELCKLLLAPNTERMQEKEPGAGAEKSTQRSRRVEEDVLHKESDSRGGLRNILPQKKFSAVLNKESVPSGGWTAGRAAARFAQKECKHRHQKEAGNYDVTQEDSRHLESKSVSSGPKRRPPRAKTTHYPIEAVDWLQSGQRDETATELTFREGGRVLKQTAKQAAQLDGKEHEVVSHPAKTEHHSNDVADAQHHEPRRERPKLSVSTLHPRRNVRRSSQGSSLRSSMLCTKNSRTAGTSQSNSHTVEERGARPPCSPFRRNCDQQHGELLLKQPPEDAASACRSCSSVTDEELFSPEDLPSFDDIFDDPDLIPDAWYEDAEGKGSGGDMLMSGAAQNNQMNGEGCREAGHWVLEPETSSQPVDASGVTGDFHPGFFGMVLDGKEHASPSKLSPSTTPAAGLTFSQLPALWDIPDDLVELVDSVPGGSPSALRPPCALRLLSTSSSSSSSPSPSASPSSSSNSSTSSSPASASSLATSSASPSRPSSAASVPPKEERAVEEVARTADRQSHMHHHPRKVLTREPYSPAETGGSSGTSSEYDERSDAEFSLSHSDDVDNVSFKATEKTRDHLCTDDEEDVGAPPAVSALTYARGVGFFQRALAHEGVRRRFDQPPPEFINMCSPKNPLSPRQRLKPAQARQKKGDRRSRTQPPPQKKARDRAAKVRKHRRRHQREECLMQRLAALHRHNLSHREYMGQFARRMSFAAVHKVFCIEFTKAERCTFPYTIKSGESCTGTCDSARPVPCSDPLAKETASWSTPRGQPFHDHAESVLAARSLCLQEKGTSPNTSVLTIEGCIANQLRQRGWVMNRWSSDSHFFDLKWKLSDADEDYRSLRREQFFNHFQNNRVITTKAGLARSLRRLAVEEQVQIDLFFPRCYHLSSLDECSDFLLDYSRSEAVTVLLAYLRCYQARPEEIHVVMASVPAPSESSRRSAALLLWMAYHIASVWLHELNPDLYLDRVESLDQQGRLDPQRLEVFASHAWCFRSQTPAFLREWHAIAQCAKELNAPDRDDEAEDVTALSLVPKEKLIPWTTANVCRAPLGSQVLRLLKQLQRWWPLWPLERGNFDLENLKACEEASGIHETVIGNEAAVCDKERKPRGNPGDGVASHFKVPVWKQHNVWVMKPSSNSKASGIQCLNNPWEILRAGRGLSDRLIQKYVERPLLLPCRRKFDMRQWVLVRSFNPLQVYVFSTLYLRLCSETYDLRDLQNRFRHVSNRHLNKLNSETQPTGSNAPMKEPQVSTPRHTGSNTAPALDSCQPSSVLEAMLAERTGNPHFFQKNVMPQIRHIVLQTLRAARPSVISRPNSFELYGFDILLDEAYRAWLIEVNLSPACAASAPWQKQMVMHMTSELLNLLFRSNSSAAVRQQTTDSSDGDHWTLVFDESVDPEEAVDTFPPIEPEDKTLEANCTRIRKNPFLPLYSQPNHKRSRWALAAAGDMTGLHSACTRAEDKSRNLKGVGSAASAASWDRMAVIGEQLSRQAEAALDWWCCFTEARKRIISWWRRTAWRRRAAKRKKLALCEDVEVDHFFDLF